MAVNVDSFNFLRSSLSKQNVLVVGDGNFSFSLSLAMCRDDFELDTRLVLTSFDGSDILRQDELTRVNLGHLRTCENVEILHSIDATKLSEQFLSRKFGRIIFNFPHTGGKSNIRKCRKLLEEFFVSAVDHVDLMCDGDICVTLCKGQGGTPVDEPRRAHGNSWQIVNNAARAGLILCELHPFHDSDCAHYQSVGYRGRLTKGFHTTGGLIHIFKPGIKLDVLEDLSEKHADAMLSYVYKQYDNIRSSQWCHASPNPLNDLKYKIVSVLNSMSRTLFEEIMEEDMESEKDHQNDEADDNGLCPQGCGNMKSAITYNNRIFTALNKRSSFFVTGTALTIPDEITCESTIGMTYLAIARLYCIENESSLNEADSEQQEILDKLKAMFSSEHLVAHNVDSEMNANAHFKLSTWTNSSEVAHLARNNCKLKRKADAEQSSCCGVGKCNCEMLGKDYLQKDTRIGSTQQLPIEFCDSSTLKVFKISSAVVIACGHLKQDILKLTGQERGWFILINLEVLAMLQYAISDIRLLFSDHAKWQQNSAVTQEGDCVAEKTTFIPTPINLFPPEHVHDISFWITDNVSQELFFFTAIALTKNCLKEIKLTEVYHEEEKHCLSFNYRMIYSRVDGPLSHFEAVDLQNRLRRALIVLGFGLK